MDFPFIIIIIWIVAFILGAKNKKNRAFLKSFRHFDKDFSAKDFFNKNFPSKSLPSKVFSSQKPSEPQDKLTEEQSEVPPGIKILLLIIGIAAIFFLSQFFQKGSNLIL